MAGDTHTDTFLARVHAAVIMESNKQYLTRGGSLATKWMITIAHAFDETRVLPQRVSLYIHFVSF